VHRYRHGCDTHLHEWHAPGTVRPVTVLRRSDGSSARLYLTSPKDVSAYREHAVWVEAPMRDGWIAAFRILPDPEGSPAVAELRVFPDHPRRAPGQWAPELPMVDTRQHIPRGGLTSRLLREIKVPGAVLFTQRLMDEFAKGWADLGHDAMAELFEPHGLTDEPRRRGRPPLSDLELARAARVYERAVKSGHPIERVSTELGVSEDTARKRIWTARDRGLLTDAPAGRPGGRLTPKARELLSRQRRTGGKR
jgi:hypothetical protein